jgi:hypothetical protein
MAESLFRIVGTAADTHPRDIRRRADCEAGTDFELIVRARFLRRVGPSRPRAAGAIYHE